MLHQVRNHKPWMIHGFQIRQSSSGEVSAGLHHELFIGVYGQLTRSMHTTEPPLLFMNSDSCANSYHGV
jgi:hypothetical protein